MIRHALPYTAPGSGCACSVQDCGGIIPAMEWHTAEGERCTRLAQDRQPVTVLDARAADRNSAGRRRPA